MVSPPPIQIATLGWEDSLILMVLALVVFGPRRLPLIGRQIGKLMYEFRKASNDFKFQMEEELRVSEEADRRKKEEEERQRTAMLAASSQASLPAPAQTVEAKADIGFGEPPSASSESNPPETAESSAETAPTIQPPTTGEQVSAPRPGYYYGASENGASEPPATAEVNPEAGAEANAAGAEAQLAAHRESSPVADGAGQPSTPSLNPEFPIPNHSGGQDISAEHPSGENLSAGAASKEPVSQHG